MKRRLICRLTLASMLAAALVACGGDALAPSPRNLDGSWTRLDEYPGNSEQWDLATNGSSISGTGSWSGEACCAGSLTLTGTVANDSLHIDVTLVDTGFPGGTRVIREHFDGRLASHTMLVGLGAYEGEPAQAERLQKQ
jgi:hypothetical protein